MAFKSSISVGLVLRSLLHDNLLGDLTIIPVVAKPDTPLPYIIYRISDIRSQKTSHGVADEVDVEINVFTKSYTEGVEIAEIVRYVLDDCAEGYGDEGFIIRSCGMSSYSSMWDTDAHAQVMKATMKVSRIN